MAYLQILLTQECELRRSILVFQSEAEMQREKEYNSAIKIQSWFRGITVRAQIRHFHELATLIQKTFRGYLGRKVYRQKLNVEMNYLRKVYYDRIVTKIQSRWRGYYVRRYKFNYYARKQYLEALALKNEIVLKALDEVKLKNEKENKRKMMEEEMAATILENRKNHYLLSTFVSRGVYNSPGAKSCPEQEILLREIKPFSKAEREAFKRAKEQAFLQTATGIPKHDSNNNFQKDKILPPVNTTKKLQGPFRDVVDVHKQRYKQLQPTLRVATDYESLEKARKTLLDMEWRNEVVAQRFLPFTKEKDQYIQSLHSASPSGRLKYGTEHFRETRDPTDRSLHRKDFQRVVSPIPLFDQITNTC